LSKISSIDTAEKDKQRLLAKLVYSGLLLVGLFTRPLKKICGLYTLKVHWSLEWQASDFFQHKKNDFKRTKWGKI